MKTHYASFFFVLLLLALAGPAMAQSTVSLGTSAEVAASFQVKAKALKLKDSNVRIVQQVPGQNPVMLKLKASKRAGIADVYIGEVEGAKHSTFFLKVKDNKLEGYVILKDQKKAYKYISDAAGQAYLEETDIDKVVCVEYMEGPAAGAPATAAAGNANLVATELQSLPGAGAVVLLDFNGQYVKNSYWNNGGEINAAPANLTSAEIIEAWKLISEDFSPFAINITTSESVYLNAPLNRRMRVIFTPTDFFYPGAGGVAYIGSFTWGDETPCWVFNSGAKYAGEAGSHEIGHTLGLSHDGRTTPKEDYFYGQASWAPIMGAGYYSEQVQWSKGEYPYANNLEDDLSIMSGQNGFGYRPDDHGNTNAAATPLVTESGSNVPATANKGFIGSRTDVDVFSFQTSGGNVELTVEPTLTYANLDVLLTLKNAANTTVAVADPAGASASISQVLPAGTYYLYIKGAKGALGANSEYGSIGEYTIKANVSQNVAAASNTLLNAGGAQFSDSQSRTWAADAGFTGGVVASKSFDVQGTTDDALYLAYRYASSGAPFSYRIPVSADGAYTVKLHFVEPYFGAPGGKTSGLTRARVFHVDMEGQRVLDNYDIYTQDGAGKAIVKTFANVQVTGGALDLDFISVVNNAIISAIEVTPVTYTLTTGTAGSGTLTRSPDQPSYAAGKAVSLTATPASGYQFTGWSGDAAGTANPLSVLMSGNKNITANFAPVQPPVSLVSEVTTTTGRTYAQGELVVGALVYTDRTYTATTVPAALNQAVLLRTANDDKKNTGSGIVSFKLSQPATVYVAYDPRATVLPEWLSSWQKVTDRVGVNDSKISYMNLYSKSFSAGAVSFGGNLASPAMGAQNNYFIVVQAQANSIAATSQAEVNAAGTENMAGAMQLSVYPNPNTGDKIYMALEHLKEAQAVTFSVHDVLGRFVTSAASVSDAQGAAILELPLNERLSQGLYIIRAKAGNQTVQAKLLVK